MAMTIDHMREALKKINKSPKWVRKVNNLPPRDVADFYKRLKQQNKF